MDNLIKWAQQEYADFLEDGNTIFADYFRDRLLPTLETFKPQRYRYDSGSDFGGPGRGMHKDDNGEWIKYA